MECQAASYRSFVRIHWTSFHSQTVLMRDSKEAKVIRLPFFYTHCQHFSAGITHSVTAARQQAGGTQNCHPDADQMPDRDAPITVWRVKQFP
jgi:hypothetical protein